MKDEKQSLAYNSLNMTTKK